MVWSRCQTQSMSFMAQLATCLTIRRFTQTFGNRFTQTICRRRFMTILSFLERFSKSSIRLSDLENVSSNKEITASGPFYMPLK